MKKILVTVLLAIASIAYLENWQSKELSAYVETGEWYTNAYSAAVSLSTTPTLVNISTHVHRNELRIWNYGSDTIYINYGLPTSSTTAAATGVKLFVSSENSEFLRVPVMDSVLVYATLAADSGTSSIRVEEFGARKF